LIEGPLNLNIKPFFDSFYAPFYYYTLIKEKIYASYSIIPYLLFFLEGGDFVNAPSFIALENPFVQRGSSETRLIMLCYF